MIYVQVTFQANNLNQSLVPDYQMLPFCISIVRQFHDIALDSRKLLGRLVAKSCFM